MFLIGHQVADTWQVNIYKIKDKYNNIGNYK